MDLGPELERQLLETFQEEIGEQLQLLADRLMRLEKGLEEGERQRCLEELFRAAHSIKGAARATEVGDVEQIAHHLESLMGRVKRGETDPSPLIIDVCLNALDRMRQAFDAFVDGKPPGFEIAALLADLERAEATTPSPPTGVLGAPARAIPEAAPAAAAGGHRPPADPPAPSLETGVEAEGQVAEDEGDGAAGEAAEVRKEETLRIRVDKLERIASLADELQTTKIGIEEELVESRRLSSLLEGLTRARAEGARGLEPRGAGPSVVAARDRGGHSAGKLAEAKDAAARLESDLRAWLHRLSLISSALRSEMHLLRLLPATHLLSPLARSARGMARELDKQVEVECDGGVIEMDRMIMDVVRAPLIHLLRNAIDHGIEAPERRREQGKPETGRVAVRVLSERGQILVKVEDDGQGISVEAVGETAMRRKLVSSAELEGMAPEQILDLVFQPGFSTKKIITAVSGRGVGLDVVRANLQALKGSVRLQTREGVGTSFTLRLPLSLATERGLLVRAGGQLMAVSITAVERIVVLRPEELVQVEAGVAVLLGARPVPLRDLATVLGIDAADAGGRQELPVVVLSRGLKQVALLVEEVVGEREMVVKRFNPPLVSIPNVAGGTFRSGAEIVVVLDAADLVESALRAPTARRLAGGEKPAPKQILVVDDTLTTRTLEKNILESQGFEVSVAADGRQAWELIESRPFDLVVADVEMPEMDGFELTERIKQSDALAAMPVIIVTSLEREADKRRGIEAGADAYIVKGDFETTALIEVVNQLI